MKVAFFLKVPKAKISAVLGRVSWDGKKKKFGVGLTTEPKFWNQENQRFKKTTANPTNPEQNRRLGSIADQIEQAYLTFINSEKRQPSETEMGVIVQSAFPKEGTKKGRLGDFVEHYQQFIQRSKEGTRIKKGSAEGATTKGTANSHGSTLNILLKFKPNLTFQKLDLEFYSDFIAYLNSSGYSTNYIGRQIKNLKAVLREAEEIGLPVNPAYKSKYFANLSEETDAIFLSESELKELELLDLRQNRKLEAVRDWFLIGCYSGQRFSDWTKICPENVVNGLIEITQQKNSTVRKTKVMIPVNPVVQRIFEKYNGAMPRLFSNQKSNDYLKEVCKLVPSLQELESKTTTKGGQSVMVNLPKWKLVCTHTARRTFASIHYNRIPTLTIMAITGHKTEKDFLKYIRVTNSDHARILEDFWKSDSFEPVIRQM